MRIILALLMIIAALGVLEHARQGVRIVHDQIGDTPVVRYAQGGADGPIVLAAHGFAGSQQMMQGYALPLARAGYRVYAFDFLGHGRHRQPMGGDVNALDGTTRMLVDQANAVLDGLPPSDQPIALLGHSMATDILVRVARGRDNVGPLILISAFSQEITESFPPDLLLITGAWEPGLRAFSDQAAALADETTKRAAVIAPLSEHVAVLHSRAGRAAALEWLNAAYDRDRTVTILPTGTAIMLLLIGVVLLFKPVAQMLPQRAIAPQALDVKQTAALLLPALILTPLIAAPLTISFLPVLVADYLGLHLLIYGVIQLSLLAYIGIRWGNFDWRAALSIGAYCALFGFLLNRYAANFWPTVDRGWIIALLALGAVPHMLADSLLTARAGFWRRFITRAAFLTSLAIAVALDFTGLFFLIMIAPVLVLFYLVFGTMGRWAGRRAGPLAPGLVLGLVLAWALGVSFPLFVAG